MKYKVRKEKKENEKEDERGWESIKTGTLRIVLVFQEFFLWAYLCRFAGASLSCM